MLFNSLKSKFLIWLCAPFLGFFVAIFFSNFSEQSQKTPETDLPESFVRVVEEVAALGQLSPSGEVRRLAAPVSGFGGTPRVATLLIKEGDFVRKNQVLATFDNKPQIASDLDRVNARIRTLDVKIEIQKKQVFRYKMAASQGAASLVLVEENEDELVRLLGQRDEAFAEKNGLEADLADSDLKAPIDGIILNISARSGERPGSDGVLEIGANHIMQALIEVYESDISRVRIGQVVFLTSENGGFAGTLRGLVKRISPQVRQRKVLSTDPTGDADARIVEVLVSLEPDSAAQVSQLTGMKVIARFQSP